MSPRFKKLALVSSGLVSTTRPPAGLAFLAGVCNYNKVEYEIIDLNIQLLHTLGRDTWGSIYAYHQDLVSMPLELHNVLVNYLKQSAEKIVQAGVDCVAITVLSSYQIRFAELFLTELRALSKDIVVIIGGPGVATSDFMLGVDSALGGSFVATDTGRSFGKKFALNDLVDYYVLGEGDIVFDKFLQGYVDFPGINTKHAPETWPPQIDNLDANIWPSYKKIDFSLYDTNRQMPTITITGSRGCVRRCSFCDVGHHWKKFRFRSGKNIADEILKHHLEINTTDFFFNDSLINGSISEFTALLETIIEYKKLHPSLAPIKIAGQFIIRGKAHHPEKIYRLMRDAGCDYIHCGVESGSESVRAHMGKKFSNDDIDYHFEMCEKYKLSNWVLMMVSYPTETVQDHQDSMTMLRRYQKYLINGTISGVNISGPADVIPNTPIEVMSENLGIHFYEDTSEWVITSNPELTIAEKYKRWVDLHQLGVELGYPNPDKIFQDAKIRIQRYMMLKSKSKKVFNIVPDQYYS